MSQSQSQLYPRTKNSPFISTLYCMVAYCHASTRHYTPSRATTTRLCQCQRASDIRHQASGIGHRGRNAYAHIVNVTDSARSNVNVSLPLPLPITPRQTLEHFNTRHRECQPPASCTWPAAALEADLAREQALRGRAARRWWSPRQCLFREFGRNSDPSVRTRTSTGKAVCTCTCMHIRVSCCRHVAQQIMLV